MKPVVAQVPLHLQRVSVNVTGCGFSPHSRKRKIYFNLYLHFFAVASRQSVTLSSAIQHATLPFGGKWGMEVVTIDSLCLPYCVRVTALSKKKKKKLIRYKGQHLTSFDFILLHYRKNVPALIYWIKCAAPWIY